MKFRDCILGKVADGTLSKAKADQLLKKQDALAEKYIRAGRSSEAAELAAEELLGHERALIEQRQRNIRQAAIKQAEVHADYESKLAASGQDEASFAPKYVSDLLQKAAFRGQAVRASAYQLMNEIATKIMPNFFETSRDYKAFANGVRALLGGGGDAEAKQMAQALQEIFDSLHGRYKAAGGVIGKIANYFPQIHRKEAIRKVPKKEWVDYTFDRLDREKMIDDSTGAPFTPEKLKEILGREYDSIITGGRSDLKAMSRKGESPKGPGGDLDMKHNKSRFMQFKSADAWFEYNERFGTGEQGLISAFLGAVDGMSRDIGVLEHMGPRPTALARFLDFKIEASGASNTRAKFVQAQYRVLTSKFVGGDVDHWAWRLFSGAQNWLRSAMLGGASISAISDTVFIAATAKVNGLNVSRAMTNYVKALAPGDREAKVIARRSGFIAEVINGSALEDARFAGENTSSGFTGWLAGLTHKFSGLAAMTRATQDSIALEGMATIAEQLHAKRAWADLDSDLRAKLEQYGLKEDEWADLQGAELLNNGEAKFLVTSDLRVDSKLDPLRAKQIADKIDDWLMALRQSAANETLLATKAITTGAILGDGGAATPSRAAASALTMFKSFPITVLMTHLLPSIRRAQHGGLRKMDHFAMVMIGTTILGGMAMQMKEVIKGKTTKEMNPFENPRFLAAAMLQGGGLGLMGDFALGDYSRFGRNPLTEITGPYYGLAEDIMTAFKGNLDRAIFEGEEMNIGRDLFKVAKRNIPLASLWYGRLLMERSILDNLERLVDPQFDRRMTRMERKMRKETGQEFWWKPGEALDQADPSLIAGEE